MHRATTQVHGRMVAGRASGGSKGVTGKESVDRDEQQKGTVWQTSAHRGRWERRSVYTQHVTRAKVHIVRARAQQCAYDRGPCFTGFPPQCSPPCENNAVLSDLEEARDEALGLFALALPRVALEVVRGALNHLDDVVLGPRVEWHPTAEEHVRDDAHRPHVGRVRVLRLEHLGGHADIRTKHTGNAKYTRRGRVSVFERERGGGTSQSAS